MISETTREIAQLDEAIKDLQIQLAGMADLRQATIRKCRGYILDAIFVLEEEKLEAALFESDLIREEYDAR